MVHLLLIVVKPKAEASILLTFNSINSYLISWAPGKSALCSGPLTAVPDNWQGSGLTNSCALREADQAALIGHHPHIRPPHWSEETQPRISSLSPTGSGLHFIWVNPSQPRHEHNLKMMSLRWEMLDLASDDQDCEAQDTLNSAWCCIIKGFRLKFHNFLFETFNYFWPL